jgi:hypothetical protein
MSSLVLSVLSLALVALPCGVFWLAVRRLWQSRSRNAVLYWLVGAVAGTGAVDLAQTELSGQPLTGGGIAVALASLPLWLLVRLATARRMAQAEGLAKPVFSSVRRGGTRAGLRLAPAPSAGPCVVLSPSPPPSAGLRAVPPRLDAERLPAAPAAGGHRVPLAYARARAVPAPSAGLRVVPPPDAEWRAGAATSAGLRAGAATSAGLRAGAARATPGA